MFTIFISLLIAELARVFDHSLTRSSVCHFIVADCSNCTICLLLTYLPAGVIRKGYRDSGWTTFEKISSELISDDEKVLDMEYLKDEPLDDLVDEDALAAKAKGHRGLPLTKERFKGVIGSKTFTNDADIDMVIKIYERTYDSVVTPIPRFKLDNMPHISSEEWDSFFTEVLPGCAKVEFLSLSNNKACKVDITIFRQLPNLKQLFLDGSGAFGAAEDFATGFPKLEHLEFHNCPDITNDGIEKLTEALPMCSINH